MRPGLFPRPGGGTAHAKVLRQGRAWADWRLRQGVLGHWQGGLSRSQMIPDNEMPWRVLNKG